MKYADPVAQRRIEQLEAENSKLRRALDEIAQAVISVADDLPEPEETR